MAQGLRTLIREFRRPTTTTHTDGTPETPVVALGGSAPTLVFAAANSSDSTKRRADFICQGTSTTGGDHLTFQLAVQTLVGLGGGRLLVCEGDYYFSGTVVLNYGIRIEGMGQDKTNIHLIAATNLSMFSIPHTVGVGEIQPVSFSHLDLDGNKANQTAGTSHGISIGSDGGTLISLDHVSVHDFRSNGLNGNRCADQVFIDACTFTSNTGKGIDIAVEGYYYITNSDFSLNTSNGIKADGASVQLVGCTIRANGSHGFSAGGAFESTPKILIGNEIIGNTGHGIDWDGVNGVIADNYVADNTDNGMLINGNHPVMVVNNTIVGNTTRGVTLEGGSGNRGGVFEGNVVRMNGQHGIYLNGDDWTVQGNHVTINSRTTTNTYDGIYVAGGTDTSVLCNMVRQTTGAPVQRYAINITAGATNCWRAGNDCRGGGWGTAAYVDAGTASILVWAGGAGDNQ